MFGSTTLIIIAGLILLTLLSIAFPVGPTPRVALIMLIIAGASFFIPPFVTFFAFGMLLLLTIQDAIFAAKKVKVIRAMPDQLARGVPAPFRIGIPDGHNQAGLKTSIRQPRCADIELSKKEAKNNLTGTITALRRGKHTLPPFAIKVRGPLGLAIWHRPGKETHEVKVFPDLPSANRLAHSIQQGKFSTAGLKRRGPLGLGTNFESVREYFSDDDMRLVNWSATARVGRPMTNQYRVEQDRDVHCLIDTGRLMTAPLPTDLANAEIDLTEEENFDYFLTRLDIALDCVCAIVSVADVMGDRSGVISFDSKIRKHLKPRRAGSRSVIKAIYDLEPIPVDSDFEVACSRIGNSKRSYVIICTDFLDLQSAKPLLRALRTITRKHRVVVASVIDTDIESTMLSPHELLAYSATQMSNDVSEVISAIKNTGAEVVYAHRDNIMLECVKSYLEAKQRARI